MDTALAYSSSSFHLQTTTCKAQEIIITQERELKINYTKHLKSITLKFQKLHKMIEKQSQPKLMPNVLALSIDCA